jgi:hypothetical protein
MSDDLGLVKDLCRQIAQQPETLAMIRATRDWPRVGIRAGAHIIFEERSVPLNGCLVVVARLAGQGYHYVGRAERIIKHAGVTIRLDDGTFIPQRSFVLRGPVVLVAQTTMSEARGET